ncbi:hypothetical protein JTE90_000191, partial [Oedothorax gibbosus]
MDSSTDEEYFDAVDDGSVDPDEYIDVDEGNMWTLETA